MINNYRDTYLESRVLSADPIELVTLMFEGALEAIASARRALNQGDIEGRSRSLSKAMAIVSELASTLDRGAGGEIAVNLARLYDFVLARLAEGNLEQREAPLLEAAAVLEKLAQGFKGIATQRPPASAPAYFTGEQPVEEYASQSWSF